MQQLQGASRFNRRAIKVDAALNLVLEAAVPGRRETVPLWQAGGRWLAESLTATTDWPPFPRSGLDGYAVRSADTALASPGNPATLRVLGAVAAGELALAIVEQGTAVRIMTGGAVPEGADAVVMLEQTAEDLLAGGEPAVRVKCAAAAGQNIAQPGEEFRRGSALAEPGTRIRPGHMALLGTFGYADVPVYARPRVAIVATGNELLPVEAPLQPGCIRDSNSSMIAAMVEQSGGEPLLLGRLADDPSAVEAALASALEQADLVVTTGGVSVGDFDVMAAIIRRIRKSGHAGEGAVSDTVLSLEGSSMSEGEMSDSALSLEGSSMGEGETSDSALSLEGSSTGEGEMSDSALSIEGGRAGEDVLRDSALSIEGGRAGEDVLRDSASSLENGHVGEAVVHASASSLENGHAGEAAISDSASRSQTGAGSNAEPPLLPGSMAALSGQATRLLFDKVAMRPGSPTSAAVIDGKLLFALSGNPGACFVGFELFVRPAILRLLGASLEAAIPRRVTARLASDFEKGSPHERFVRTRLLSRNGELLADPLAFNKSSMMASIPEADGLIRIPAGQAGAPSGSIVDIIVLH
ncbi:hypothetical protein PAECIP111893_04994 [Paenibacillus plantiphilus]|uniref:Molybdopterin molybdenumtransferase n=1 Tax=Paenibacillus plantiphilus TaxID=2905650 RepID=A0ABM9CSZ9_9BACL|nr:molybdopterin molybdotransferase MoeA [Paenibacillus plantiphilus]CAH1223533.1 hypothetical protein PAECIP111893_04994 [Paenibacillus plantiphilus]